jgi:hypothetical protein
MRRLIYALLEKQRLEEQLSVGLQAFFSVFEDEEVKE